jgi:hypothetical protein
MKRLPKIFEDYLEGYNINWYETLGYYGKIPKINTTRYLKVDKHELAGLGIHWLTIELDAEIVVHKEFGTWYLRTGDICEMSLDVEAKSFAKVVFKAIRRLYEKE